MRLKLLWWLCRHGNSSFYSDRMRGGWIDTYKQQPLSEVLFCPGILADIPDSCRLEAGIFGTIPTFSLNSYGGDSREG